jgi:response regulator of citrate/malate metabolism
VPDDFFTIAEWANKLELSRSHTRRLLLEGTQAGKIERREFRAAFGKIVRRASHYRLLVKT